MNHMPTIVEVEEEEVSDVEVEAVEPKVVEINPITQSLKKLTKHITKYKRQMMKATSEEEQSNIQKSIDYINTLRFILKMSQPNKCLINKVLTYIESPHNYDSIIKDALAKIERDEI